MRNEILKLKQIFPNSDSIKSLKRLYDFKNFCGNDKTPLNFNTLSCDLGKMNSECPGVYTFRCILTGEKEQNFLIFYQRALSTTAMVKFFSNVARNFFYQRK